MATLQYISATRVEGASKYNLYRMNGEEKNPITTSQVLQEFQHYGVMWNGKEIERTKSFSVIAGNEDSAMVRPLRMITEKGARYYIRVTGIVNITRGIGFYDTRPFDSVYYLDDESDFRFFVVPVNNLDDDTDGYYLLVNIDGNPVKIRLFDLDPEITDIEFGKRNTTVTLYSNDWMEDYRHTEYIPISSLSDDFAPNADNKNVCVGPFSISNDFEYHKMSFYNKNLKFVGGATTQYLEQKYGNTKEYFNLSEVEAIAGEVTGHAVGSSDEDAPKFVVFCSKKSGTSVKDIVCVGNNGYFPLFAYPEDYFVDGNNDLAVTADSDSDYYEESIPSNVVIYEVNKE